LKKWEILGKEIQPNKSIILEIKLIMKLYGYPKDPTEVRWTYIGINFKGLPSTIERPKLNCITNTNQETKRRKIRDNEKAVFDDYQDCVEEEAEHSSSTSKRGKSSSKIDSVVSILKLDIYRSGIKCL